METPSDSELADTEPAWHWLWAFVSRWIFLSSAWLLLHYAPTALAYLPHTRVTALLLAHVSGPLYHPWALWFIDYYWLAFTLAGPLYFYGQRGRFLLHNDKYQALLAFLLRGALQRWGLEKTRWSPLVRLGLLSVMLKLFFMPYMVTWAFENVQQIWAAMQSPSFDFHALTVLLIKLCLMVDTAVFGFGYLVESRRLGSEIRSVDPYWLGWLACLWCYPPFNNFTFLPFDVRLFPIQLETTPTTKLFFNGVETFLWAIFAWASLALGFKASNLTARGTVRKGPYRWVRHPAYTAKLGVWWIQGIIFGDYSVGILLAFTVVYGLRAWTEERHLLAVDADYADYVEAVRWRIFPRIL